MNEHWFESLKEARALIEKWREWRSDYTATALRLVARPDAGAVRRTVLAVDACGVVIDWD